MKARQYTVTAVMLSGLALSGCSKRDGAETAAAPGAAKRPGTVTLEINDPAVSGGSVNMKLRIRLDDGWHTYSDPPGDSGMAPDIEWRLPEGYSAGTLQYPTPETFREPAGTTYGYAGNVVLTVPLRIPDHATPGTRATVAGTMSWLVCKEVCTALISEIDARVTISSAP